MAWAGGNLADTDWLYGQEDYHGPRWTATRARPDAWMLDLPIEAQQQLQQLYDDPNADHDAVMQSIVAQARSSGMGPRDSTGGTEDGDANLLKHLFGGGKGAPGAGGGFNVGHYGTPGKYLGGYAEEFSYPEFNPTGVDYPEWNAPEWGLGDFQAPTPTTGAFVAPENTVGVFKPPEPTVGNFDAGPAFAYEKFVGPTAENFTADPGYDFRKKEGERAFVNNKAAEGIMRTGGAIKGLMEYNQGLASQEFGNVFNRQLTTHQTNLGAAERAHGMNFGNRLAAHGVNAELDRDRFGRAHTTWDSERVRQGDIYDRAISTHAEGRATDTDAFNRAKTTYDTLYGAETGKFNRALTTHQQKSSDVTNRFNQQKDIYGTNFGGAATSFGLNQDARNSKFRNLLSLYDLSTRYLPTYSPSADAYAY